ncbi:hypothetical protein BpHYR1_031482 [Brachionus plicatilis]|uniref:Uncharacterized protein n=1 Tax=Brachionus plicatilis TaxID=10195 RepID=A0A3M7PAU4_BRAPC|nr:hypothetical protein BpHYR1_031482 [Brachionus plicatilis]
MASSSILTTKEYQKTKNKLFIFSLSFLGITSKLGENFCARYIETRFIEIPLKTMGNFYFFIKIFIEKCSNIFAFDERIVDIVDVFTPYSLESVVVVIF